MPTDILVPFHNYKMKMTKAKGSRKGKELAKPPAEKQRRKSSCNSKKHATTSYDTPAEMPGESDRNSSQSHTPTENQLNHNDATSHDSVHIHTADFDDDDYWNDPALLVEIDRVFAELESRSRSH